MCAQWGLLRRPGPEGDQEERTAVRAGQQTQTVVGRVQAGPSPGQVATRETATAADREQTATATATEAAAAAAAAAAIVPRLRRRLRRPRRTVPKRILKILHKLPELFESL